MSNPSTPAKIDVLHLPGDATKLTDMARPRVSIHAGPAGTQPASLTDIINAMDWQRINAGLTYALMHGGNLPPGFMQER